MRRCANRRPALSGFSLIEVVIVLFLTGLILSAVSRLVSQTMETLRFLEEKGRTTASATLGCERLSSELREAVSIDLPIPSGKVVFYKVRPDAAEAVANNYLDDSILPQNWARDYKSDAHGVDQRFKVSYFVDSDSRLQRTVEPLTMLVATEVNSFVVSPAAVVGSFKVSLSIKEKRRVVVFETIVTCPALRESFSP